MANISAYRTVYYALKKQIQDKVYPVGSLLPTEPELEKIFHVSRTTIRRAVSLLVADGYLKVRQGKGTEVLDISVTQRLNEISSVTETLKDKGYHVTTQGMWIQLVNAPLEVAEKLELSEKDKVYQVQRVQYADGAPIALIINYLKRNLVPNLENYIGCFTGLYAFLEEHYHVILKDAVETLSAVAADFTESQILRVGIGTPLLCSKRISNTEQGPFEYSIIKLVADKYEYSIYLQGRKTQSSDN